MIFSYDIMFRDFVNAEVDWNTGNVWMILSLKKKIKIKWLCEAQNLALKKINKRKKPASCLVSHSKMKAERDSIVFEKYISQGGETM